MSVLDNFHAALWIFSPSFTKNCNSYCGWGECFAVSYLHEQPRDLSPDYYRGDTLLLRSKCESTSRLPLKGRGCLGVIEALSGVAHMYVPYLFPSQPRRIISGRPLVVVAFGHGENWEWPWKEHTVLLHWAVHLQICFGYKTSGLEWQDICRVNL